MRKFFNETENEIRKQIFEYEVVIFEYVLRNLENQEESLQRVRSKNVPWAQEIEKQFGEILPEYIEALNNEDTISLVEKLEKYRNTYQKIELLKKAG